MAKQVKIPTINTNLFARTEPAPGAQAEKKSKHYPVGVYLTDTEKAELDGIIEYYEGRITKHMVLQYAIQRLLAEHKAGTLQLETEVRAGKVVIKTP